MMRKYRYLLLFLLMLSPALMAAVTVTVDRNPVHVNESFQLFFEADETPDGDPDFSALQQYFTILNTSQNSSISIINGNYQRSIKWSLQLMPKQVGEFVIPAIRFGDDKTEPFQISVKPAAKTDQASGQGLIFELYADRETVAVQGQLIVTMRLMSDTNIAAYEFGDMTIENVDVVTEPLGDVKRFQTRLGDKPYLVLEQKFALFPQNSGDMEINPVLGQVRLSAASNSVFDPFQRRGVIRSVNSPPLKIGVTGIDPAFSGKYWLPAKTLRLSEVWLSDLDNLVAGEPITRTIMLVAEGLTAAQLPPLEQDQVDNIKQYPDQASLDDQRSDKGIVGVRQQKVALIPTEGGQYTLPEIRLPWWNTETARQEVATIPSRTITVRSVVEAPQVSGESEPIQELITPPGAVQKVDHQQTNRFWVWLSLFLACGWLASAAVWWLRYRRVDRRQVEKDLRQIKLKQAARLLKRSCEAHNAVEAREALMLWAGALPVGKKFRHLNQLADDFGEPLKTQIDILNKSLYAATKQDWQGHELWRSCQAVMRDIEASASINEQSLPALNP